MVKTNKALIRKTIVEFAYSRSLSVIKRDINYDNKGGTADFIRPLVYDFFVEEYMIKRIIFDVDNTLLDTYKDCINAYAEFLKDYPDIKIIKEAATTGMKILVETLKED